MMVAAVSGTKSSDSKNLQLFKDASQMNPTRTPLLYSEKDNQGANNVKKPKAKVVSSRYLSPSPSPSTSTSSSSSRRFPSPLVARNSSTVTNSPAVVPKRSVSVDRRRVVPAARPLTPDLDSKRSNAGTEASAATKMLIRATRSLSVSFQGEAFSLPISKTKAAPPSPKFSSVRKATPERKRTVTPLKGKDQLENSKQFDQHRWPGREQQANSLSRSSNYSDKEWSKLIGSGNAVRALHQSMIDERRDTFDRRYSVDLGQTELSNAFQLGPDGNSMINESSKASDLTASDTDSISSGSTSGGPSIAKSGPHGASVSARFWQETNSRFRRLQDPGSPVSTSPRSKLIVPPKVSKFLMDGPLASSRTMSSSPRTMSSPARTMSSPVRGSNRPASPSKPMTPVAASPSRGMYSPSRIRNAVSTICSKFVETPSVLSYAVDVRRGKVGENRIVDAHLLRLLYNRHLQWRLVNARTEATLSVQKHSAENNLWNAWITISDLRDTVTRRRHRLQLLRQKLKLASILKGQVSCLEEWAAVDKNQYVSLLGAIEALKASTLRLPVVGGAVADIQSLKEAIGSAVDVMQSMASSMGPLLQKVDELNLLMIELAKVAAKEEVSIEQCKDFLAMVTAVQVKDCSLKTQILQHNRISRA